LPHHVIQRGNGGQAIFLEPGDYAAYLQWLRNLAPAHGLHIHAYVLMPNHVHLLGTPGEGRALGRFMQAVGRHYVRQFNERHGRRGGLWDGRFRSTVLDPDRYLLPCMQYIELNPVRAGLVAEAAHYRWSSFAHHVGTYIDPTVSDHSVFWSLGNTPFDRQLAYQRLFDHPVGAGDISAIRSATQYGWALGEPAFLEQLAKASGRRPASLPRGRPRGKDRPH
jgi:putative transposase